MHCANSAHSKSETDGLQSFDMVQCKHLRRAICLACLADRGGFEQGSFVRKLSVDETDGVSVKRGASSVSYFFRLVYSVVGALAG